MPLTEDQRLIVYLYRRLLKVAQHIDDLKAANDSEKAQTAAARARMTELKQKLDAALSGSAALAAQLDAEKASSASKDAAMAALNATIADLQAKLAAPVLSDPAEVAAVQAITSDLVADAQATADTVAITSPSN